MSGVKGHRAWGNIKRQRTKKPSYQASYRAGPTAALRANGFRSQMSAERWLSRERDYRELPCKR
jgi:hypothetical protein